MDEARRTLNIALVYLDAGGGHRAAAQALAAVIRRQGRPWNVQLVQLMEMLDPQASLPKLTGRRFLFRQDVGRRHKETLYDRPRPIGCDAGFVIKAAEQRRGGVPLRRRHGNASLGQVPVQNPTRQSRQRHFAGLAALAKHMKPNDRDADRPR